MNNPVPATNLRYVTKRAAAAYLSCSPRLINLAIADGSLRGYKPRRNFLRLRLDELDKFMEGQTAAEARQAA